ncbi:MAG: 1-acyl-sn-glycerol-3-phosphate acyltransferase [Epsilonproteobacteria bacterium]|nr:1-acyl-sn-glycerol-3-phosphate acyltransferase [Campylobacterota bacterium]
MKQIFKKTKDIFQTLISYACWIIGSILIVTCCCPLACLPASIRYDNRLYFFVTWIFSKLIVWGSGATISVSYQSPLPSYPDSPALFLMNHTSSLDIPLFETIIGTYPHVWISKASYKKIPLLGFLIGRMHVSVQRDNPEDTKKSLFTTIRLLKDKPRHLLIFPEGTRHQDGQLHPFNPGFAILAAKLKRPVIPVMVDGLHKIFPKKRFLLDSSVREVKIVVGSPLCIQQSESIKDFCQRVHTTCNDLLASIR